MEAIKLTGLWIRKDKNGNTFLCGNINAVTAALVMSNGFKQNENDPDYYLYLQAIKKNPRQSDEEQDIPF